MAAEDRGRRHDSWRLIRAERHGANGVLTILAPLVTLIVSTLLVPDTSFGQARKAAEPDAQGAAKLFWDSALTKCGDSRYRPTRLEGFLFDRPGAMQYKDVSFYLFPDPISRADELNGIQWHGLAVAIGALFRTADRPDATGTAKSDPWGNWQDGTSLANAKASIKPGMFDGYLRAMLSLDKRDPFSGWFVVRMEQKQGKWTFDLNEGGLSCLDVPGDQVKGTPEYGAAEAARREKAEAAQREARLAEERQAEADRIKREDEARKLQAFAETARRAREPRTDLERKTQSDGYWTDPRTGLVWAAKDSSARIEHRMWQPSTYCKELRIAGRSDWRWPTLDELQGIGDTAQSHDFYDQTYGGGMDNHPYHIAGGIMLSWPVVASSVTEPAEHLVLRLQSNQAHQRA